MTQADSTLERDFSVQLPGTQEAALDQDAEWCIVRQAGTKRRIRFHDYHEIYALPGLYERLFYDELKCTSPTVVREQVARAVEKRGDDPTTLKVLDVGAGNGMVGEELATLKVDTLVGVDIIQEAADATERDRPGIYDSYRVVDLTDLPTDDDRYFRAASFNALTTVAALGFGDIPPNAFAQAYNYIDTGGLVAFTIKEDFVTDRDPTGFNLLIQRMLDEGIVTRIVPEERYRHRLSVSGTPLYYLVFVVEKLADIPADWLT